MSNVSKPARKTKQPALTPEQEAARDLADTIKVRERAKKPVKAKAPAKSAPETPARKPDDKKDRELTIRQRAFADNYLISLNATKAYKAAGFTAKNDAVAGVEGHKLLKNPKIAAYIDLRMRQRTERIEITQDRVLQEVARLAFADPRRFFREDGTIKHPTELDDDTAASMAQFEVLEEFEGHGEDRVQIGFTKKLKWADKKGPLELLMRHMGMLNDKLKLQGDPENPLVALLQQVSGTALPVVKDGAEE